MGAQEGGQTVIGGRGVMNTHSPWQAHTFMMWAELEKSAEEGGGARLVREVGGLGVHWAGMRWEKGERWKENGKQGVSKSKGGGKVR